MQLKNEEKIKIFSYKYCEIFWEGFKIFKTILKSEIFLEKLAFFIILTISGILFYYPILNFTLYKNFNLCELVWTTPLILVIIFEKYKNLQPNNKIKKNYNKIVNFYSKYKKVIAFIVLVVTILCYFFCKNLEKVDMIKFLKSDKIYIVTWIVGVLLLEALNKKDNNNIRCIILCMYSIITILLFASGIITFYLMLFKPNKKVIYPLNTIIVFILVLLIVHKLIINLKSYKKKKKDVYDCKIKILKDVLRNNNIKEDKYNEILKRSVDKSEEYYNLENKFTLIARSLLLWGGISIIIEKIKNIKLEMIKNLIQEISAVGILKFLNKIILE